MPAPTNAATSPRLQRVLAVLGDGLEHSTREIADAAHVVAVDTAVRELRGWPNNLPIHRRQVRHLHFYRLAPEAVAQAVVQQALASIGGEPA